MQRFIALTVCEGRRAMKVDVLPISGRDEKIQSQVCTAFVVCYYLIVVDDGWRKAIL